MLLKNGVAATMRRSLLLLFFCFLLSGSAAHAQDVFSVGPTLHYNFGEKKPKVSWGVEAALWWYKGKFPISANLGVDLRKGSTVLYTQAQTGIAVAGLSVGPYLEIKKEEPAVLGLQTDYWLNYYAGINYRVRYGSDGKHKALGLYLKAPLVVSPENEEDESDWDWDWD